MLLGQLTRALRVVIDIGLHLHMRIPANLADAYGPIRTPETAAVFLGDRLHIDPTARHEIRRYLSNPTQALSHKLGERAWLNLQAHAPHHDLASLHATVLDLGPLGLDLLTDTATTRLQTPAS